MTAKSTDARFEIDDLLSVRYSYHYGAITPFFEGLTTGAPPFRVSACDSCGVRFCPPRHHCRNCWGKTSWVDHDGGGTIESLVWAYWVPFDSPARNWTDLPYAYGAIRLDGCQNLLRTRITGLQPTAELADVTGRRGSLRVVAEPSGRPGDLYFEVPDLP